MTVPKWADDIGELQTYIADAQHLAMNVPQTAGTGEGIHIGIIDSTSRLPDRLTDEYTVNQGEQNSFVKSGENQSTPHAHNVFNQLSSVSPQAEFSIYRAINENGDLILGSYADAISKALDDGVDIINISAGDPWRGPINANPTVAETARLIERGVTVVAAAGNYFPEK